MGKINTYDQYMEVLTSFKQGKARCRTNKMMMRDELAALIDAGKLSYEEIDGTLWFFSDEDYFYSAHLYAPKDAPIQMQAQDKDVLVELMGKGERYDEEMEKELIGAGYRKGDRYSEYGSYLKDIIDYARKMSKTMHRVCELQGYSYRLATKADYPELRTHWLEALGEDSYTVLNLTDAQLDDMEQNGRCVVICDEHGKIVASSIYLKSNKIAYSYLTATSLQGSGLGTCASNEMNLMEYEAGCERSLYWIKDSNMQMRKVVKRMKNETGKFYYQFVMEGE